MNKDLRALEGECEMNVNEQAKTNEYKTPTERLGGKIKTSEIMIIVGGSADEPCYSIRYYDLSDNEWHVGFSSYFLSNVMDWKNECFEIVEPVERIESAKPMETKRNWEAECKRLKDEANVRYKELDQIKKELECKNRELIQLKEKHSDLIRKNYYLDGKTDAYEYAIKCFEKGSWTNEM